MTEATVTPLRPEVVRGGLGEQARTEVRDILHTELNHFLQDIEFRLSQTYELMARMASPETTRGTIYAEDMVDLQHRLTGYTVTANHNGTATTPGNIAWSALKIVYAGVEYTIADGTTALRYATFVKPGSYTQGTPVTLQFSNTVPTLAIGDAIVFFNENGVPTPVPETTRAVALANGTVATANLVDGAVQGTKILDGGIGTGKLGSGAINLAAMLGSGVVGGTAIADGGVGANKLGTGAVNLSAMFGSGVVGNNALGPGAVTPSRTSFQTHLLV